MERIKVIHSYNVQHDRDMEFHISKNAREKYNFKKQLFGITGNVIVPNLYEARVLADKINSADNSMVKASDIFAMGLIDEILHFIIAEHRSHLSSDIITNILKALTGSIGEKGIDNVLMTFVQEFPGSTIIEGTDTPIEFLQGYNDHGVSFKEIILEEVLLLHLANINPALGEFKILFDDKNLKKESTYSSLIDDYVNELKKIPSMDIGIKKQGKSLYDLLRAPAIEHPNSLVDQLNYIIEHWGVVLSDFNLKILKSLDSIKEEYSPSFCGDGGGGAAPGVTQTYNHIEDDIENFTTDKHWMPNVMLMAKSAMVWLDQLSKKYKIEIKTLDQIPDIELDTLRDQGFNGLWLIGLWNRSEASKKIKKKCGNPEAEASAYSLYNYDVNEGLGGWSGLDDLKTRCAKRGIRLASDMVPNHTGIDSEWVRSKPDFFIQSEHPPFPTYTFNDENLSDDPNIGIYLEDHYYSKNDASVVFKRVDFNQGDTRYIYHGNDGTMMPWNDTAQINFLNPEAREAVIQDILHVARNFPIIRFDAAMTLAKKHIQRLWFPQPGHGGDIASRSDYAMSQEDFDRAIPKEFWREVVDRIAVEAPDTLLLAEAFWMLEGYFVRTLGMHRVYNSAFMNMLKKEENEKYRHSIINTIKFDPDILKRYVNFMNNPDEDTAFAQFGSGDKYFGVCTLMITLPGLPMFGHGQIEGYKEKYGMEYSKAYWDEDVDQGLVEGHNHLIFPLMKKREIFSEVENFNLYPFIDGNGNVNNNVFAYTNNYNGEHSLVLYNNCSNKSGGWINHSEEKLVKGREDRYTTSTRLAKSFNLHFDSSYFTMLTNQRDGLTYIRSSKQIAEEGMFFGLNGYETQVFLNIYEIKDVKEGYYAKLHHELNGVGVENVNLEIRKLALGEIYTLTKEFFMSKEFSEKMVEEYLIHIKAKKVLPKIIKKLEKEELVLLKATLISEISKELKIDIIDDWLFSSFCINVPTVKLVTYLRKHKKLTLKELFNKDKIKESIGVHEYNDIIWFDKDKFTQTLNVILKVRGKTFTPIKKLLTIMEKSEYKFEDMLKLLK